MSNEKWKMIRFCVFALAGRPMHWAAPKDVDVQVEYGLSGAGARVDYRSITRLGMALIVGDARGRAQ